MKKSINKFRKIISIILATILVIVNVPLFITYVEGEERETQDPINILVEVRGYDNEEINNVTFQVSEGYTIERNNNYIFEEEGENAELIPYNNITNETDRDLTIEQDINYFPLTIYKGEGAGTLKVIVYEKDREEHNFVLEYNETKTDYDVQLGLYAKINNDDANFDFETKTYVVEKNYGDAWNYDVIFDSDVVCELEEDYADSVSFNYYYDDNESVGKGTIDYSFPGNMMVHILANGDVKETHFLLKVKSNIHFSVDDAKNGNNIDVKADEKDNSLVDTVTKIVSKHDYTYTLPVSGNYTAGIDYTLELEEGSSETLKSSIDNNGTVTIKAVETLIINAVCTYTGEKVSYKLIVKPTEENLKVKYNNEGEQLDNGTSVSVKLYDSFSLGIENKEKYNIEYDINNPQDSSVLTYDEETGMFTVGEISDEYATIMISATRLENGEYYKVNDFVINICPVPTDAIAEVTIIKDGKQIGVGENTVVVYYDNDISDIVNVNGVDKIIVDISANVKHKRTGANITDYHIKLSSNDGLSFDSDNAIINVDDIERNRDYTIKIKVYDNRRFKRFNDIEKTITFRLESNKTNNENGEYYSVTGLHIGADEETLWKDVDQDVTVLGKEHIEGEEVIYRYFVGVEKNESLVKATYIINEFDDVERYNKEHKIFVYNTIEEVFTTTRLYFGVDETIPEVLAIKYREQVLDSSSSVCSNEKIVLDVLAYDYEDNLHSATLYAGDTVISSDVTIEKTEDGKGICSFVIETDENTMLYDNVGVVLVDLANNKSVRNEIGTILIEKHKSDASFAVVPDENIHSYEDDGKSYYSEDVEISVNVTDLVGANASNMVSGLSSYDVFINGKKIDGLCKSNLSNEEKCVTDTFFINTSGYDKNEDGSLTIIVNNIVDMAGNVFSTDEGKSFTVFIDNEDPTAIFESVVAAGKENITNFGNFYNDKVTYTFNVSDNMTGIKSAKLSIGNTDCDAIMKDGKLVATIGLNNSGDVKLVVTDNVERSTQYNLAEIKDTSGNSLFSSNYVLLENIPINVKFDDVRATDKGNWYNSDVAYTLNISDVYDGVPSAGIADVSIKINGIKYNGPVYAGKDNTKDSVKVNIDRTWIDKVINANGSYTVNVTVTDNAGNVKTYNKTVYIDTVAPVISDLTGVANGSVNTGVATVNVEVFEKHFSQSGNGVTVSVKKTLDGVTTDYAVDKFASTSAKTTKAYAFREDGTYTVVVSSEDAAGNKAVDKSITFTVDNTAPLVDITGVKENTYYTESKDVTVGIIESNYADMDVVISITKELNGNVTVLNSQVFNKTGKESSLTQKFAEEGTYTIKVDAVDAAGNVAITRTVIFTVDNTSPSISITGVKDGVAYKDAVKPTITINDNYYKDYTVSLIKNGVQFGGGNADINSAKAVDVTNTYIKKFTPINNGVISISDTFEMIQTNDGIYTLKVTATDLSGRSSVEVVNFSVNRFGSVYTFDSNLIALINSYNTVVTNDIKITEYNANRLVADSINVRITRDGAPINDVLVEKTEATSNNVIGESGWYQYDYIISKDNFKKDGVYVITVSSKDEAGNSSENIVYDKYCVRFSVDTTKPELVKVTGLSKNSYNSDNITVSYEVFDSIGLKEVKVYLDGKVIQTVSKFEDATMYSGSFTVKEGMEQHISFQVTDIAGNIVDSDNSEDVNAGKIAVFENTITVSTNAFVRWYANKKAFYGTIIALVTVLAGGSFFVLSKKRK